MKWIFPLHEYFLIKILHIWYVCLIACKTVQVVFINRRWFSNLLLNYMKRKIKSNQKSTKNLRLKWTQSKWRKMQKKKTIAKRGNNCLKLGLFCWDTPGVENEKQKYTRFSVDVIFIEKILWKSENS